MRLPHRCRCPWVHSLRGVHGTQCSCHKVKKSLYLCQTLSSPMDHTCMHYNSFYPKVSFGIISQTQWIYRALESNFREDITNPLGKANFLPSNNFDPVLWIIHSVEILATTITTDSQRPVSDLQAPHIGQLCRLISYSYSSSSLDYNEWVLSNQ